MMTKPYEAERGAAESPAIGHLQDPPELEAVESEGDLSAHARTVLRPYRNAFARWLNAPVDRQLKHIIEQIPTRLNEYGYDPLGMDPHYLKWAILVASWLYKYWFRVEMTGQHNIPHGRTLLISNHSGQVPIDGIMIGAGLMIDATPPRAVRAMVERWVPTLPIVSTFFSRCGQIVGTPENCRYLLRREETILVFPEGVRGINKLWWQRYQLATFGLGFMRLALETDTPIVPIAVVGAEEQYPTVYNFKWLARLLGMPAVPVTPLMLGLGPIGALPLPTKYRITIGEAMRFEGDANDEDVAVERKVREVRARIRGMITYGLKARRSIFY